MPPLARPAVALLAALLAAAPAAAQPYLLRTSAVPGGSGDASGGGYTLRGSVDNAAGLAAQGTYALGTGFWYQAAGLPAAPRGVPAEALPPLALTLSVPPTATPGAALPVIATFVVGADGPEAFGLTAEVTLPDGRLRAARLGPATVLATPGTAAVLALRLGVPEDAPPGGYAYTVYAGTYPEALIAVQRASFSVVRAAGPSPTGARRADGGAGASASPSARDEPWPVYAADGRPLGSGAVLDLRPGAGEVTVRADVHAAASGGAGLPAEVTLAPPYPNPSAAGATLWFGLPEAQRVRLTLHDALGREVAVLVDAVREAGHHAVGLAPDGLPSGVYHVRLEAGGTVRTRRLTRLG